MKDVFVTITGFNHYYGKSVFAVGNIVKCVKEPDNAYDGEAIRCEAFPLKKVGYIANSVNTVAGGTLSAGRIYDSVKNKFYVKVMFITHYHIICKVMDTTKEVKKKYLEQGEKVIDSDSETIYL